MKHRAVAINQAFMLMGVPKIPKMTPFQWDKRKCAHWARKGRKA